MAMTVAGDNDIEKEEDESEEITESEKQHFLKVSNNFEFASIRCRQDLEGWALTSGASKPTVSCRTSSPWLKGLRMAFPWQQL